MKMRMKHRAGAMFATMKAINGFLFAGFGVAIAARVFLAAGFRPLAIPGVALGLAMFGLGVHRLLLLLRPSR